MKYLSVLLFLLGSLLAAKGWWNAHYGKRGVWEGMVLTGIGGLTIMASVLIFGLNC